MFCKTKVWFDLKGKNVVGYENNENIQKQYVHIAYKSGSEENIKRVKHRLVRLYFQ